jgi:hypothetical protein
MITADTITDEQILFLRSRMMDRVARGVDTIADRVTIEYCSAASAAVVGHWHARARSHARARCAEILNAMRGESS